MTDSKTDAATSEEEVTLDNAELAEVQGGRDLTAAFLGAAKNRNILGNLRERLRLDGGLASGGLKGATNYHIKDSGPSWVDSPRHFDLGGILTNPANLR